MNKNVDTLIVIDRSACSFVCLFFEAKADGMDPLQPTSNKQADAADGDPVILCVSLTTVTFFVVCCHLLLMRPDGSLMYSYELETFSSVIPWSILVLIARRCCNQDVISSICVEEVRP